MRMVGQRIAKRGWGRGAEEGEVRNKGETNPTEEGGHCREEQRVSENGRKKTGEINTRSLRFLTGCEGRALREQRTSARPSLSRRRQHSLVPTPSAYSSHSLSNPTLHFKNRWNVLDMDSGYQKMTKEEERSWMKMAWSGERRRAKRLR